MLALTHEEVVKESLVYGALKRANGSNIHRVNGLVGMYRMHSEVASRTAAEQLRNARLRERYEEHLQHFIDTGRLPE